MSLGEQFSRDDALDCVWLNHGTIFAYTPSTRASGITKEVAEGKTTWGIPLALMARKLNMSENDIWCAACRQEVLVQGVFESSRSGGHELWIAFRASVNHNEPNLGSRPIT
jgi:hypothetical protein